MTTLAEAPAAIACSRCSRTQKSKAIPKNQLRLPHGWKRAREREPVCPECWRKAYLLRALIFPVAEPLSGSWRELDADLHAMWSHTTAAANWMMTECYARDVRRTGEEKMPAMNRLYLYPEARERFPGLPPQSVSSLEQTVQRRYRAVRYDVIWRCSTALPTMRYPQPYPVHVQSWDFRFDDGNRPIVRLRLGEGVKWWELRLKGGALYRRQLAGLKRMAERGELAIYRQHGDGAILVKLVGWLARDATPRKESTLVVRTAADSLLVALDGKAQRIWLENCDHLRRWIAEHNRKLQRWSEDQKAEQRPVPSFAERREEAVRKQRNRVKSALQEVAAHLGAFAERRKFAAVEYDDSDRGYMGGKFPYYLLAERIKLVLHEKGIEFVRIEKKTSGETEGKSPESLAEGEE